MKNYELSKIDFAAIDQALQFYIDHHVLSDRHEQLKEQFAAAHTAWLEMEDDND